MKDIKFEIVTSIKEFPYSFKTLKSSKIKELFPDSTLKEELEDDDIYEFINELELELGVDKPRLFLLDNKYILLEWKYSGLLYPSLKDFKNSVKARRLGRELGEKSQKENPIYYKKQIEGKDPQERILLTIEGEQRPYYQYSPKKSKTLLDTFPAKETVDLGRNQLKLISEDGRIALYSSKTEWPPSYVFMNEADFELWRFPYSDASCKIWRGRNPYHEKIFDHKEELLQQLADITQLKREQIEFGIGTHHIVHRALEKLIYNDRVANELFLPLTIYLGEQQINWYGGEWKLIEKPLIKSWIPVIHFQNHDYDIGKYIMWELLDPESEDFPAITIVLWNGKSHKPS
jgi:hypothetical protein